MANRQEVLEKRNRLSADLRAACRDGRWSSGDLLPAQAELARSYQLSVAVVHEEVRKLIDEGLFYSVPRVGTFVGTPRSRDVEVYLLILPWWATDSGYLGQIRIGFEERIAQLGCISLMLTDAEARELHANGKLPPVKGIFAFGAQDLSQLFAATGVPCVCFGNLNDQAESVDAVRFDDEDGGFMATRHLLANGHHRIAFLGLHTQENQRGDWQWSADREIGWKKAMTEAKGDTGLAFRLGRPANNDKHVQIELACEAALPLVQRNDIDAIIAVSSSTTHGLFEALKRSELSPNLWPAVVGFDEDPALSGSIVSYMRPPWEHAGRKAAEVLQGRANGKIVGPAFESLVPMRLIPRLSCREHWTLTPGLHMPLNTGSIAPAQGTPYDDKQARSL